MTEIRTRKRNDKVHITLPPRLALAEATQLKDVFVKAEERKLGVVIDFEKVSEIKTPCIQILMASYSFFTKKNYPFIIKNLNSYVKDTFSDLGLKSQLEQMEIQTK